MGASFSGRASRWSLCGERERAKMVVVRGRSGTPDGACSMQGTHAESCTSPHLGRMDDSALLGFQCPQAKPFIFSQPPYASLLALPPNAASPSAAV
jgi:hypothetical protein